MKKISIWLLALMFTLSLAQAQESATQQQLDKLSGQLQDMADAQALQGKRLDALEREINELREKVNTPVVKEDFATRDDLKRIANQINEIEQKRKDDREVILTQIDKVAKIAATPAPPVRKPATPKPETSETPGVPQNGYEYEIKPGDNLGLIIKAFREKGVKVTKSKIIEANPKINPDVLIPGKKLFIPDPSAK